MPSIRDALRAALSRFPDADTAALDARVLMCHALDVALTHLLAHPEQALTDAQAARFESLVARRAQGEPIAYIVGQQAFYDRHFSVSPAVLIPRPETEHLLEAALDFASSHSVQAAADIGTGSGALAVTFAAHQPDCQVWAIDISPEALAIAQGNASQQSMTHVQFLQGDLAEPLIANGQRVDLLMANLPYIARDEVETLAVSAHEPRLALDGGPDGLDLVRRLLAQVPQVCRPGALILLEIGADQGLSAQALAHEHLPGSQVTLSQDYAGHDRLLHITLPT